MGNGLPAGFEELEHFVGEWVLADSSARSAKRQTSSFAEVSEFYDGMLKHSERALEYLSTRRLGELGPQDQRLLKLCLSLAEVGPAVEWYESPQVLDGFPADRFPMTEMIPDTEPQR